MPLQWNFFVKSDENFKKHIKVCDAKEGITYSFNNGEILFFQDKFKFSSDVPFTVYFDFETTTGDTVILIQKCLLWAIFKYIIFILA